MYWTFVNWTSCTRYFLYWTMRIRFIFQNWCGLVSMVVYQLWINNIQISEFVLGFLLLVLGYKSIYVRFQIRLFFLNCETIIFKFQSFLLLVFGYKSIKFILQNWCGLLPLLFLLLVLGYKSIQFRFQNQCGLVFGMVSQVWNNYIQVSEFVLSFLLLLLATKVLNSDFRIGVDCFHCCF